MDVFGRLNAIGRLGTAVIFSALAASAQANIPADQWLPDGAVYSLQVSHPEALLAVATELKLPEMLLGALGKSVGQLAGAGIAYAMYPGENSVWVFEAQNGAAFDALQKLAKAAAGSHGFYQEYPGNVTAWSFDGKQFFARSGNRLVLSNHAEILKALFAPRKGSLGSSALYCAARRAAGSDPAAWAFVNMAMLNQYPPAQKSLAASDLYDTLFNGALKQSLRGSTWLAMGLEINGKKLRLHAVDDGKMTATGAAAFTAPSGAGILPNLEVPRELAAVSLWRDLGQFYSEKETLFPEKTSYGILAENFLEIFFTGRDLSQEVFGRLEPQVRLVAARQQYDPATGTPAEQYPAVAAVLRIKPSSGTQEDLGEVLEEAWQKAVGLNSFIRGQSAEPGVLLDRESYGGVTFTYGAFSTRAEKDRQHLPSRFNYRPAIVRDGPYIILSSTDGLARDLIDAVHHEDARGSAQKSSAHTVVEVTGFAEIAALLNVNRGALVRQSVLSSGKKPEQAAREFDQHAAWLKQVEHASLAVSATAEGQQADLDIDLK